MASIREQVNSVLKSQRMLCGVDPLESDIVGYIRTGWSLLDRSLGGGLPMGRLIELFGEESVGKSALMWQTIASCQSAGGVAIVFEPEASMPKVFAERLGVDLENLWVVPPSLFMEEFFTYLVNVLTITRKELPDRSVPILVVWDSLPATPTRAEGDAMKAGEDISRTMNPLRAQILRAGLRNVNPYLSRLSVTMVLINHVVSSLVGMSRGPETNTPGGRSLKYLASARIHLWTGAAIRPKKAADGDPPIGTFITAKLEKSKVGVPKRKVRTRFYYNRGFSDPWSIWDFLVDHKAIKQLGSWYYLTGESGKEVKFQGEERFPATLSSDPTILPRLRDQALSLYDSLLPTIEEPEGF